MSFRQFFLQHFLFFVSSMFANDNIFLFLEALLCRSDMCPLLVSRGSTISCVFIGKKGVQSPLKKDRFLRNECCKKCNFLPGGLRQNSCPCCLLAAGVFHDRFQTPVQ